MINDEILGDEQAEARFLLTKAIGTEPAMGLRPSSLLRRARRRAALTHGATAGGVAVGVIAAVVGMTTLAGTGQGGSGSVVGTASSTTQRADCVHLGSGAEPCAAPGFTEDDRSRALTEAVQGARKDFIPARVTAGPRVRSWPGADTEAFKFVKPNQDLGWPYYATAEVGDAQGSGTVILFVGDAGTDGRCASLDRGKEEVVVSTPPVKIAEFVDCTDRTLTDGTLAAVSTYRGRDAGRYTGQQGYRKIVVDAVRPDGTRLHLVSDNHMSPPATMTGVEATRPAPPLDADALLKIAQIPGLKY